jgi:dihydrofolate reductase
MRKLKLQMQVSADGFAADKNGGTEWMVWNWGPHCGWDTNLRQYVTDLTTTSDLILLSRKLAEEGFHAYWDNVASDPSDPRYAFAKPIAEMKKVVFSKTLQNSEWRNTELAHGGMGQFVWSLKQKPGKDILVYGGPTFASSLIKEELLDECHIFCNPAFVGTGSPMFNGLNNAVPLKPLSVTNFPCGVVVNHYKFRSSHS